LDKNEQLRKEQLPGTIANKSDREITCCKANKMNGYGSKKALPQSVYIFCQGTEAITSFGLKSQLGDRN
jgi:hypothetical protein